MGAEIDAHDLVHVRDLVGEVGDLVRAKQVTQGIPGPFASCSPVGGEDAAEVVLDPNTIKWLENTEAEPIWPEVDWATALTLKTNIGVLDNPYLAQQHLLTIDLSSDPLVVFGSAGRGKSTFVKSLLITLAESQVRTKTPLPLPSARGVPTGA